MCVATRPIDVRKGPDGLAALVHDTGADTFPGPLYVSRAGRRADRLKSLWWDGSGLCLFAKRPDEDRFRWPRVENGVIRLAASQLMALEEGLDWTRVRPERSRRPTSSGQPAAKSLRPRKPVPEQARICFMSGAGRTLLRPLPMTSTRQRRC